MKSNYRIKQNRYHRESLGQTIHGEKWNSILTQAEQDEHSIMSAALSAFDRAASSMAQKRENRGLKLDKKNR